MIAYKCKCGATSFNGVECPVCSSKDLIIIKETNGVRILKKWEDGTVVVLFPFPVANHLHDPGFWNLLISERIYTEGHVLMNYLDELENESLIQTKIIKR